MDNDDHGSGAGSRRAVIRRKLEVPEPGDDIVRRDRLTTRIRHLIDDHPVVTVCATAGGGKTAAVTLALRDVDRPVAWLSLDGTEQAPGRLLVYLEAAIEPYVPAAARVASDALRNSIQIGEAAGLLAESLQGSRLLLVCDNVERIIADEGSVVVLSALARYLPADVNLVLISRTSVPLDLGSISDLTRVGELGEADLAFDADEAAEALRLIGHPDVDVEGVVESTGGWVAGVLFEGWRTAEPADSKSDALRGYLSANILRSLTAPERTFLLHTSPLAEVSAAGAVALGQADGARVLARLRSTRLPASWSKDGSRLIPHPQFREFLIGELARTEDPETVRCLHRLHADLLVARGGAGGGRRGAVAPGRHGGRVAAGRGRAPGPRRPHGLRGGGPMARPARRLQPKADGRGRNGGAARLVRPRAVRTWERTAGPARLRMAARAGLTPVRRGAAIGDVVPVALVPARGGADVG